MTETSECDFSTQTLLAHPRVKTWTNRPQHSDLMNVTADQTGTFQTETPRPNTGRPWPQRMEVWSTAPYLSQRGTVDDNSAYPTATPTEPCKSRITPGYLLHGGALLKECGLAWQGSRNPKLWKTMLWKKEGRAALPAEVNLEQKRP